MDGTNCFSSKRYDDQKPKDHTYARPNPTVGQAVPPSAAKHFHSKYYNTGTPPQVCTKYN